MLAFGELDVLRFEKSTAKSVATTATVPSEVDPNKQKNLTLQEIAYIEIFKFYCDL